MTKTPSNISTAIDLKLSMKDIIDMMIDEEELRLENIVTKAVEEYTKVKEKHKACVKKIISEVEDKFLLHCPLDTGKSKSGIERGFDHAPVLCRIDIDILNSKGKRIGAFCFSEELSAKHSKKYKASRLAVGETEESRVAANRELRTLSEKSKRAKSAMVRQLLLASKEGKDVLSKIKSASMLALPNVAQLKEG